jgi:MoaA/NifB/PqqE/SkfB family radical SAM enzyme
MKNFNLPINIAFTIIKQNIGEIEYIINYAKEVGIRVGFNIFDSRLYFFQKIDTSIAPTNEEIKKYTNLLIKLKREYSKNVNGSIKAFKKIPDLINDPRLPHYYCVCTLMELFIDSFGNVRPGCWAMAPCGNIKQHKLSEILNSNEFKRQRLKGFLKKCPGCTCGYELDVIMNLRKRKM